MLYELHVWLYKVVYFLQLNYLNPYLEPYLDAEMILYPWLFFIVAIVCVLFIIPAIIFVLLYATVIMMYIYKHRRELEVSTRIVDYASKPDWNGLIRAVAVVWEAHGRVWHGFEIDGFANIPHSGAALIVYYHGALPIDHFYLMTKILLYKKRFINSVGDHFLFMLPGSKRLMRELKVLTGPVEECVKLLKDGNILSIAPGGVREAQFGDERYKLIWKNRIGFAKVATEAKVPIIPVFTQNVREAFISVKWCKCFFKPLYEWTKLPIVPFYGGFPVKLKTYIGEPILYDPNVTPDELAIMTKNAIEQLIRQHQTIPGSISRAFLDRFRQSNKKHE